MKDNEKLTVKPGLEEAWEKSVAKNQDIYGHGVVEATSLVGAALDDQATSPEQAMKACYDLGLTGFMAGCMAGWIAHFHPRGEEFRRWWNKDNQIGTEGDKANESGGVLNPALLSVSPQGVQPVSDTMKLPDAIPEQVFDGLRTWDDPGSRPNLVHAQRDHEWNFKHLLDVMPRDRYPLTAAHFEVLADLREARDHVVRWMKDNAASPASIDYVGRAMVPILAHSALLRMGLLTRPVWGVVRAAFSSGLVNTQGQPDVDVVEVGDATTPFGALAVGNTPTWANFDVGTNKSAFFVWLPDAGKELAQAFKVDRLPEALVLATQVPRMVRADLASDGIATADILSVHVATDLLGHGLAFLSRRFDAGMYAPRV